MHPAGEVDNASADGVGGRADTRETRGWLPAVLERQRVERDGGAARHRGRRVTSAPAEREDEGHGGDDGSGWRLPHQRTEASHEDLLKDLRVAEIAAQPHCKACGIRRQGSESVSKVRKAASYAGRGAA